MSTLKPRLAKPLHKNIKHPAKELENEARKSNRKDFEKVLKAVPDVEPEAFDRL